jgi:hypothetical protein
LDKDTVAIVVTIVIFILGLLFGRWDERRKQKEMRRRYLMALKEEITINVRFLEKCVQMACNLNGIDEFLRKDKGNRPIITYVYFSTVFSSRTEVLQDLNEEVINKIVDFYGKLAELKADIEGVESKAFEVISDEGRRKCIDVIVEESKLAKLQGSELTNLIGVVIDPKKIRAG